MNNTGYYIRNYQPADFNRYVLSHIEAEDLEPTGVMVSSQVIAEILAYPNFSSEKDLFLVEAGREIIGHIRVIPELTIERVVLDCWVHPEHRKKGLATKLLEYAIKRAAELGMKVAHVNIAEDNEIARTVLSRMGFEFVRRFLELKLYMADIPWQDIDRQTIDYGYLKRGEEEKLTQIQNRSFAGSWGYNPNTVETITYSINLTKHSLEDVVLISELNRVIGYCWTEVTGEDSAVFRAGKGRICMMGVDPNHRGRGIGRRALLSGLDYLKSNGVGVVELTVDSENEAALALYQSNGFKVLTSSLWYEKSVH